MEEIYIHEEIEDELIGKKGTPKRDKHDEPLEMFLIGEAIKQDN